MVKNILSYFDFGYFLFVFIYFVTYHYHCRGYTAHLHDHTVYQSEVFLSRLQLSSQSKSSDSDTTNKTITWTSSDENICKIDSEEIVSANNTGKATIIAKTSKGKQASIEVVVNPVKVT